MALERVLDRDLESRATSSSTICARQYQQSCGDRSSRATLISALSQHQLMAGLRISAAYSHSAQIYQLHGGYGCPRGFGSTLAIPYVPV